jgi:hypothetical protein
VRALIIVCGLLLGCGCALAQTDHARSGSATVNTGRTAPEDKGQLQPQGWTGPIDTQSGGAPPESPQGQSPPGMQAAPEGSTKTIVAPEK